jgi:hypothetical protein
MTFDVAILCSIGTAFAMCLVSLAQDLIAYCTGVREPVVPAPEIALVRAALPEGCLCNGSTACHDPQQSDLRQRHVVHSCL